MNEILETLLGITSPTVAILDAEVMARPGLRKTTKGARVLLLAGGETYGKLVKTRLKEAGKNPDDFVLSDLPWGEKIEGTSVIKHKGEYYCQTAMLSEGDNEYFIGRHKVSPEEIGLKPSHTNQGLGKDDAVVVRTYKLSHIVNLTPEE